jgi:hypothetical protein
MGEVKEIVFGKDVRRIPDGLCSRMGGGHYTSIKRIVLPDSLVSIGRSAFEECYVESIVIPDGVRYIGDYAFNGSMLMDITMNPITPPTISGDSTYIFPDSTTIYVPCLTEDDYRDAWPSYAHQIHGINEVTYSFSYDMCEGDSYYFHGQVLSEPGIYRDTLRSHLGCDSIVELRLMVYPAYYFYREITILEGEVYNWNGMMLTEPGDYRQYYQTIHQCDSVCDLRLNVIKMCSWLVESNDQTMGSVITTFHESAYPYDTQITVEASPNSGYKFVKWNDGKKYNPYTFSLLEDKYLLAIFIADEQEQDTTTVQPSSTSATFTWPFIIGGFSYSLTIYLDAACTIPLCTITFNQYGQVIEIHFGNMAPRRMIAQDAGFTYTVSGLDANTEYYFKMETMDEDNKLINTDEGAFKTTNNVVTAIDQIENRKSIIDNRKVIINGQIFILRGNSIYTIQGQLVK